MVGRGTAIRKRLFFIVIGFQGGEGWRGWLTQTYNTEWELISTKEQ